MSHAKVMMRLCGLVGPLWGVMALAVTAGMAGHLAAIGVPVAGMLAVLAASGVGLVEINEALGPETAGLFRTAGYKKTEILRDIFSKDRFVKFASSL